MKKIDDSKNTDSLVENSNHRKSNRSEKKKKKTNYKFSLFELCFISINCLIFGIVVGCILSYNKDVVSGRTVSSELKEFVLTYNSILDNYYGKVKERDLVDSAISGMIDSLEDPYTVYMESDVSKDFNETVNGSYVGIGVTVEFVENGNKIIEIKKDGPADIAGLKKNDIIISANGKDVSKLYGDDLTKHIKGKKGTKVKITVLRDGKEKDFIVVRDKIFVDTVSGKIIEKNGNKIGYLKIDSFSEKTFEQVNSTLNKLNKDGMESLIIDVRYNPGGHLLQTRNILDLFLDKNVILYQVEEKGKVTKIYSKNKKKTIYPIVILANNESASASEILVSSLKENYKNVKFVGETTYGKGTIQKAVELTSGSSFKYTTQRWLTASGKSVDKKGIAPDYEVHLNDEYYYNPIDDNDDQLQKALELLS